MEFPDGTVNYEAFGAIGDGVADDLPAICKAHDYANENGLSVKTKPEATYHLGKQALTVIITTDTDWNTSRFTIDDAEDVEDHKASLFEVRSLLEPEEIQIDQLTRDQKQVDARPKHDCHVLVENDNKRIYIRRGLNQNNGAAQNDGFILRKDGTIDAPIDWEYDVITKIVARPIDDSTLFIRGGIFTTFANCMKQEVGYNYWSRNIVISRSNTEVDGLTHYVVGETAVGHPYTGFISVRQCADITLRNCFATGHKMYSTIGAAGKPVNMGSYDYNANNVVNFTMIGCRMNHITDRTHWGVIGSNFCKNILLEDCTLSRMDTHMGVAGSYVIRRCELGHMGLNAIGRGKLLLEDSTLYGRTLVSFRNDYGSTWQGNLNIKNCRWIPACGDTTWPHMINTSNDGMHDFGYPCSMPTEVIIDGLFVDDSNHPDDYQGMYFFTDPDGGAEDLTEERPFPYKPCQKVTVKGLTTASGKKPHVSPNENINANTVVIEEN
ncbi:MAG: hypothetical protein HN521_11435 [Candidatus Latescibacteria bacterium]|jgi:hypothetical protein|nr:hypothetical protein [Candidatus Latescibacterota bacterium]MBT5833062.1 hypothetical protein [Candidatus Latescibacterota bacterium]